MPRPPKKIDWNKVDEYLEAGATGTEVAAVLGMHPNTLYRKCEEEHKVSFSDYSQQKREKGNSMLKLTQYNLAMDGDRGMLIWLGKNRLDQSDKKEVKHDANVKTEQNVDLSKLSIDELKQLESLYTKIEIDKGGAE
jgi:transposase-like protein